MTPEVTTLEPRILSALIGALFVAVGWFVTAQRERRAARRARLQRERDLRTAIAAEIGAHVAALRLFDLDRQWRLIVGRMEDDPGYVPVVPTERNTVIFLALLAEVQILPQPAIEPVVRYYTQLFAVEAIVADLRSRQFRDAMGQGERIEMFTDYIALKQEALARGEAALAALHPSPRDAWWRRSGGDDAPAARL